METFWTFFSSNTWSLNPFGPPWSPEVKLRRSPKITTSSKNLLPLPTLFEDYQISLISFSNLKIPFPPRVSPLLSLITTIFSYISSRKKLFLFHPLLCPLIFCSSESKVLTEQNSLHKIHYDCLNMLIVCMKIDF